MKITVFLLLLIGGSVYYTIEGSKPNKPVKLEKPSVVYSWEHPVEKDVVYELYGGFYYVEQRQIIDSDGYGYCQVILRSLDNIETHEVLVPLKCISGTPRTDPEGFRDVYFRERPLRCIDGHYQYIYNNSLMYDW